MSILFWILIVGLLEKPIHIGLKIVLSIMLPICLLQDIGICYRLWFKKEDK